MQNVKTKKEEAMGTKRSKISITVCFLLISLFLLGIRSTMLHAAGSTYPDKPITLIIPFVAGGAVDLTGRALAEAMEKHLKQPVVVVNKPGASATMGGYAAASAKPDGYTLGLLPASGCFPEVYTFFYSAPYSSSDLRPICPVTVLTFTIAVKDDAPWNNFRELIEYARKNPRMKYGHNGRNLIQYVALTTIAKAEKVTFVDVPFEGDPQQIAALLGGHIPIITAHFSAVKSLSGARKVKVLAVLNENRPDFLPDIPTIHELGYKVPQASFTALSAPKRAPDEVVKKLYEVVDKVRKEEDFRNKTRNLDLQVAYEDPASFEKSVIQLKERLHAFFTEEGMVK